MQSLNLEGIGLSQRNIEIIVDHLIERKVHEHMNYINLFHNDMGDHLSRMNSKLLRAGYRGYFKTLSDWALFVGFWNSMFSAIGRLFAKVGYLVGRMFYFLFYPFIFMYKKLFRTQEDSQ